MPKFDDFLSKRIALHEAESDKERKYEQPGLDEPSKEGLPSPETDEWWLAHRGESDARKGKDADGNEYNFDEERLVQRQIEKYNEAHQEADAKAAAGEAAMYPRINDAPDWVPGAEYKATAKPRRGNVVYYDGEYYECRLTHEGVKVPPPEDYKRWTHAGKSYAALKHIRMPLAIGTPESETPNRERWTVEDILKAMRPLLKKFANAVGKHGSYDEDDAYQEGQKAILQALWTDEGKQPFGPYAAHAVKEALKRVRRDDFGRGQRMQPWRRKRVSSAEAPAGKDKDGMVRDNLPFAHKVLEGKPCQICDAKGYVGAYNIKKHTDAAKKRLSNINDLSKPSTNEYVYRQLLELVFALQSTAMVVDMESGSGGGSKLADLAKQARAIADRTKAFAWKINGIQTAAMKLSDENVAGVVAEIDTLAASAGEVFDAIAAAGVDTDRRECPSCHGDGVVVAHFGERVDLSPEDEAMENERLGLMKKIVNLAISKANLSDQQKYFAELRFGLVPVGTKTIIHLPFVTPPRTLEVVLDPKLFPTDAWPNKSSVWGNPEFENSHLGKFWYQVSKAAGMPVSAETNSSSKGGISVKIKKTMQKILDVMENDPEIKKLITSYKVYTDQKPAEDQPASTPTPTPTPKPAEPKPAEQARKKRPLAKRWEPKDVQEEIIGKIVDILLEDFDDDSYGVMLRYVR